MVATAPPEGLLASETEPPWALAASEAAWRPDALQCQGDEDRGEDAQEGAGILNWWKRGSTNSFLEGLNPVVQSVRSAARGFRSIAYFRTIIFLRLGRLDFTAQKKLTCATH
jgi:hypothetical protein